jgi:type IV fimbrial biogenesis protein FimT
VNNNKDRLPSLDLPAHSGFTVLELMATLTVAAVLLTVGVPGFLSVVQNNRATAYTNDVVTALNLARAEAMRRRTDVIVCRSVDGTHCANGSDWSTGWVVRTNAELIRSWPSLTGRENIVSGPVTEVRYQPRGTAAAARSIAVLLPNCSGDQGRDISVNRAGRVAVTRVDC